MSPVVRTVIVRGPDLRTRVGACRCVAHPARGTVAMSRRSSIAIGHACSFPASPIWRRCATSRIWSVMSWRAIRPAQWVRATRPCQRMSAPTTRAARAAQATPGWTRVARLRSAATGDLPLADVVRGSSPERVGGGAAVTEPRQGTGWRLDWRELSPPARSISWDQLWDDAIRLRDRYSLVLRSAWWEDDIQVEALAALAALISGYDTRPWNDPVSKLHLLFDLDRIRGLLHAGQDVFDPDRDRSPFAEHSFANGCQPDKNARVSSCPSHRARTSSSLRAQRWCGPCPWLSSATAVSAPEFRRWWPEASPTTQCVDGRVWRPLETPAVATRGCGNARV
jgi:hypothetical protein